VNAVIIDEDALHLEVCSLAIFLGGELDERVLQAIAGCLVANNLARQDFTEAREYEL